MSFETHFDTLAERFNNLCSSVRFSATPLQPATGRATLYTFKITRAVKEMILTISNLKVSVQLLLRALVIHMKTGGFKGTKLNSAFFWRNINESQSALLKK